MCCSCDVTGKQTVLKQGCYTTKSLTKGQIGTAQNKHSVISRYLLPPKPCEDLQRLSLPEEWKCPRLCALGVHCDYQGRTGLGGSPRQGHSPSRSGAGCRPDQQFPISLHATIIFWLPRDAQSPLCSYRLFIHD